MGTIPDGAPTRFDALLVLMGLALFAGVGIGLLSTVPLGVGSAAGSLIAGAVLLDGVVWNPPSES